MSIGRGKERKLLPQVITVFFTRGRRERPRAEHGRARQSYQLQDTSHETFQNMQQARLDDPHRRAPLARIIAHKMPAWVPHRKHTRRRRAVRTPARAEARRRRDIERGRIAERLRPRTTTSRLTCAESSASEFLSRHPPRSNPPWGLCAGVHPPARGREVVGHEALEVAPRAPRPQAGAPPRLCRA